MRYVKWIFIVMLVGSLASFVDKDKSTKGLNVGDVAPDFVMQGVPSQKGTAELSDLRGHYVLISFWASYDAQSRMQNASLSNGLKSLDLPQVEMVSISFDKYPSVYRETVRKDQIAASVCLWEKDGETSDIYKTYRLKRGFTNYLLDEKGVIVAKNISAANLPALLGQEL